MKQYYYAVGDDKKGPVTLDALKAAGITPDTLVWYEGMDNWVPAVQLTELTDLFGGLTPSAPNLDGVSEDLSDAASAAGEAIHKVGDAAEGLVDKAGDMLGGAADKAGHTLGDAAHKAGDLASGAAHAAEDAVGKAGDMLSGAAHKAGGMAAGAGAAATGAMAGAAGAASGAFGKASGALSRAADNAGGAMSTGFKGDDSLGAAPPKTWLLESILVTVLCCLPFGIAGIVNASKVESRFYAGDIAGAQRASEEAAKWTKIGGGLGIAGIVLYFIIIIIVGVGSSF